MYYVCLLNIKMSKRVSLTIVLSSSLLLLGDTYSGVSKSFKALAKFCALHTFALVVGPRILGILSNLLQLN